MEALIATFTSPGPKLLEFGPFVLRWYGLLIAISVLIGLNLSNHLASRRGLKHELINDLLPILILSALVGARIYYVAFEWREYRYNWIKSLAIWEGGIAIHGALIGGTIAVFIFCRLRQQSFTDVLDVLLPSVVLGQGIGRWGNFFNNEAFGLPTDLPWKLLIPLENRPEGLYEYEYFHPTFLYESIWNILVFSLLMILFKRNEDRHLRLASGTLSCIYLISYSLGRILIEGLRTDPLCLGSLPPACAGGIRVAQLMSLFLIFIGALGLWWLNRSKPKITSQTISNQNPQ